ncbi:probable ATP-dependent RNA helicase ddx56 isoform X6 [Xenia sp. Carnegie-2017]|uniref:probable ATP-dependent RNA helicase ddx56 isoform X6 n=1 Tax=Xenia sp. Carnegie-2017 TaxID=2897299 RepID=UPI001F04F1E5|nr:probable ATP-dependent RNA helicase ddx56 isoform X6 [Xenia sp. Carnegie-2017]
MKITYLVIALGLLCTFAYAQAKLEDGVMKESDEHTAPVETVEEELVENDDENPEEENDNENPEEERDDETDPEHDLEQSDDRELTENNNDVKADPSVEKRSPFWSFTYYRRRHNLFRRPSWRRRRRFLG